jgi:Protein of unknown function (DUF2934)
MESVPVATGVSSNSGPQTTETGNVVRQEERVALLAYALWQYRGCPIGSPEQDWLEAERQLLRPHAKAAMTVGVTR